VKRAALLALAAAAAIYAADTPENPRDVGLVEQAATRLGQIDVTVTGPKGAIEGLTTDDFELRLNDKIIPKVIVDDLCVAHGEPGAETAAAAPQPSAAAPTPAATPRPGTATYLLYFDMPHLTQSGRQNAIESARDMIGKLLAGGNRAMVLVSATELKTVVPMTSDAAKLTAALTSMVTDRNLFDPYAVEESRRRDDIVRELTVGVDSAIRLARRYASEERWRQERDLRRLSMTLGRMAEFDPPKAVLYFADTMRQNAGEHYLSFFSATALNDSNGKPGAEASAILMDAATGALPLDRVINEASAMGIRFYTVEGEGINAPTSNIETGRSGSSLNSGQFASASVNTQQIRDSQGTLTSLAAETGGRAFLNGVAPARMASQILGDMSCLYLLSFDPAGFAQDKPISVSVTVKKPKVKATARGRLVIQSEAARSTARVLSAFATPGAGNPGDAAVRVGLIPIGYAEGRYKARVQVALGGSRIPGATWDIGASVVSKGIAGDESSGRIQTAAPNTPVVFEQDMEFAPGEYNLVTVAHEVQTDTILSKETHGAWPKIDTDLVSLSPISVSQPQAGGFLKNGVKKTEGAVVLGPDEPLRADLPTAVITLVCRAKDQKKPLEVVRTLIGEQETPVGTTRIDPTSDRCAQVVDLIPPKTLGAGTYRFAVKVSSEGVEMARSERPLTVPAAAPVPGKSGS
jgi:VWFA-related protein